VATYLSQVIALRCEKEVLYQFLGVVNGDGLPGSEPLIDVE